MVELFPPRRAGVDEVVAADVNTLRDAIAAIQSGAAQIPLAGIAGALGEYGPTRAVRSPLEFGGAGDGVTDDYAAIRAAYDALPSPGGGVLTLSGLPWYSSQTLHLDRPVPIEIDGGALGRTASVSPDGGYIKFAYDIDGIVLHPPSEGGTHHQVIRNLGLRTPQTASTASEGSGSGIVIRSARVAIDHVIITGFRGHGICGESGTYAPGININAATISNARITYCGRNGLHLNGEDSNICVVTAVAANANRGYGFYNNGSYTNVFICPHTSGNLTGDFYESSWGSSWISPYSEGAGKFVFAVGALHGVMNTGLGGPSLWFDDGDEVTEGFYRAVTYGWNITDAGRKVQYLDIVTQNDLANQRVFRIGGDSPSDSAFHLSIRDTGSGSPGSLMVAKRYEEGNAQLQLTATKLGFYGATAIVKPTALTAANAGTLNTGDATSDTVIGNMRTRINELETKLQALGLLT